MSDDLRAELGDVFDKLQSDTPITDSPDPQENITAPTEEVVEQKEITDQPKETIAETADAKAAIQAPVSWSAEDKAKFAALPPEAQEIVARRESERDKYLTQKSEEYSQLSQKTTQYDSAFAGMQNELASMGMEGPQAAKELVALYNHFKTDPYGYIMNAAQSAGIDLKALVNGQIDPREIYQSQQNLKIASLEERINTILYQREEVSTAPLRTEIEKFSSDPANEHFEAVKPTMARLLETGEATDLKDAYEKAIWANPATREAMLQKQEADRIKAEKEKSLRAKKSAGIVLGSEELSTGGSKQPANIRDFLSNKYDEIQSGAA